MAKADSGNSSGLYGSGLSRRDWYLLRDAVGYASAGALDQVKIPEHLREHEAAVLLQEFLNGKKRALNRAAQALVPGSKQHWLVLMKS